MRMRGLGILVAVASTCACASATHETKPSSEAALSCTPKPRAPGDRSVLIFDGGMHVNTTVSQEGQLLTSAGAGFTTKAKVEVTELPANGASGRKLRLHYVYATLTQGEDGKTQRSVGPSLAGKTYLATLGDGAPVITDTAGKPVSDDVAGPVGTDLGAVILDPLARFLSAHPLRAGQRLVLPDAVARGVLHMKSSKGSFRLSSVTVTLKRVRKTAAGTVVDLDASAQVASGPSAPIHLEVPLEGTLTVHADTCRVASVRLSGPAHAKTSITRAGQHLDLEAKGRLSFEDRIVDE